MEKESFINDILNSTNGMTKVHPNADIFSKIERRLQVKTTVSASTIWLVAASIVVLIGINVGIMNSREVTDDVTSTAALATTISKSNQLY